MALAVRVGTVLATTHARALFDAGDFQRVALSIVNGHGYGQSTYASGPSAYRPPAYPFFLAGIYSIVGLSHLVVRFTEAVIGAAAVGALGWIASTVWDKRTGLIAMLIGALYLPLAVSSVSLVSEALFVPFELGAIAAMLRARVTRSLQCCGLAGLLLGLAAITRSNGALLFIPVLMIAGRMPTGSRGRAAIATAVAMILVLVPWTARNEIAIHGFQPVSTETSITLASVYNDDSVNHPATFHAASATPNYRGFFPKLVDGVPHSSLNEIQLDSALRSPALTFISHHLGLVAKTIAHNLRGYFRHGPDGEQPGYGRPAALIFYLLLVLAAFGMCTRAGRRAPAWLWVAGIIMLLPVLTATGQIRFRAPLDPLLILPAAAGIAGRFKPSPSSGDASVPTPGSDLRPGTPPELQPGKHRAAAE